MISNPINAVKARFEIFRMKQDIKKFLSHVHYSEVLSPNTDEDDKEILKEEFFNNKGWDSFAIYLKLRMNDYDKTSVKQVLDMLKKYGFTQENYTVSKPFKASESWHPGEAIENGKMADGKYIYTVYMYLPDKPKNVTRSLFFSALRTELRMKPDKELLRETYGYLTAMLSPKQR